MNTQAHVYCSKMQNPYAAEKRKIEYMKLMHLHTTNIKKEVFHDRKKVS